MNAMNALRKLLPDAPASSLRKLLRFDAVTFNGRTLRNGDRVHRLQDVDIPRWALTRWRGTNIHCLDSLVLHETEGALAIDKPAGMCVQGGRGVGSHHATLTSLVKHNSRTALQLVHRLDGVCSGAMVLARDDKSAHELLRMFKQREIAKEYVALLERAPRRQVTEVKQPVGGKSAYTLVEVEALPASGDGPVLVRMKPRTGRQHQLRLHAAEALKAPIVGDERYGASATGNRRRRAICLHSRRIEAPGMISAEAPVPAHMQRVLEKHGIA